MRFLRKLFGTNHHRKDVQDEVQDKETPLGAEANAPKTKDNAETDQRPQVGTANVVGLEPVLQEEPKVRLREIDVTTVGSPARQSIPVGCPYCGAPSGSMCAYPSKGKPGCWRDHALDMERRRLSSSDDDTIHNDPFTINRLNNTYDDSAPTPRPTYSPPPSSSFTSGGGGDYSGGGSSGSWDSGGSSDSGSSGGGND